ncbi:MAG TPA: hypothetical protein VFQ71_01130 [Gaiellales bacterium]|jgi:hypothetical protein|nr:hypothetical protein [Gaiellales bacterium]
MSTELEQRLERMLPRLPGPTPIAERQARRAALEALPPPPARSPFATRTLAVAAALVATMAGVALAARSDSLPELRRIVASPTTPGRTRAVDSQQARLPAGAHAFTVLAGGRVWIVTAGRGTPHRLRLAAAATSPDALYLVGQRAGQLEAVSVADRHVAWSRALSGRLVGAAWSPYPIRIAYVAGRPDHERLHVIWGNGVRDDQIGRAAPVIPAWRSDSLAYAYVTVEGRVVMRTVGAKRSVAINSSAVCGGRQHITELAFAPHSGTLLEVTDGSDLILADTHRPGHARCIDIAEPAGQAAWLSRTDVVYGGPQTDQLTRIRLRRRRVLATGSVTTPGPVAGFTVAPRGGRLAVAVNRGRHLRILVIEPPRLGAGSAASVTAELGVRSGSRAVAHLGWG